MSFKGYNENYLTHLLHIHAGTGQAISKVRWNFIAGVGAKTILDYGCGTNIFALFRPDNVVIDSYDIGTMSDGASYPQTGIRHDKYDLICLWDVIEHVDWELDPDMAMLDAIARSNNVALAVPVLPEGIELESWKHYKPGEHLTYFTIPDIEKFFNQLGFTLSRRDMPECPPREDVVSFLFKRFGDLEEGLQR